MTAEDKRPATRAGISAGQIADFGKEPAQPRHVIARLRNYFLTGLIIAGPLAVTLYIVWSLINWIDSWVKPVMPDFYAWLRAIIPSQYWPTGVSVPGVGLLFAVFGLTLIGALAANLLGRTMLSYAEFALGGLPVVRSVYKPVKQIFETVFKQGNSNFRRAGLIEFPRKGVYSLVFVSSDTLGEIPTKLPPGEEFVTVFMPSCPPTSGFLMFVRRSELIVLDMTVEAAAKMVLSAGIVTPEFQLEGGQLAELAPAQPQ
jgi:uncharacterized membrane protein